MLTNRFKRDRFDNTLFIKSNVKDLLIVQVYVDDIIFEVTSYVLCEEFAELMNSELELSMMGERTFFLGLQIKQSSQGTSI